MRDKARDIIDHVRGAVEAYGNNYALHKKSGVPLTTVQGFRQGGREPRAEQFVAILLALGGSVRVPSSITPAENKKTPKSFRK